VLGSSGMQLTSLANIRELRVRYPLLGDLSLPPFTVELDSFSPQQNKLFQDRLNHYHASCGCGSGAATSVSGLIIFWLCLQFGGLSVQLSTLAIVLIGAAVFGVAGTIGKLIGIGHAHWQLRKLLGQMARMLEDSPAGLQLEAYQRQ
jgi:hypothetical protein